MHLKVTSELSEVNLFGLGVQKVLLELSFFFCFVFFFLFPDSTRRVQRITNPSPAACLSASVSILLLLNSAGCLATETILL